jgi:type IV pilus assembly protein PilF
MGRFPKPWLICLISSALFLSACVTVDPAEGPNEAASKINVQLGMGYLQQNNMVLASEKLTKALRQDPDSSAAHNAYAILQDRLLQKEKAEEHYIKATELDPGNSQAANNYGAFLCRSNREAESEAYFLQALKNPLYGTPEFAYTNAALCLIRIKEVERARIYLRKALAAKNNFPIAVFTMAGLYFDDQNFKDAKRYIDRYHLVATPTSRSLWLSIRIELELGNSRAAEEHASSLEQKFPDSDEYKSWLALN